MTDEDFCAAVEREIEFWARLRKSQGKPAPGCTPSHYVDYLYGGSGQRAAHAFRRREKIGLVTRRRFDCGGNGWRLTPAGSALAQDGILLCRGCAVIPSLPGKDTYDRCAACAADKLDDLAEDLEETAAWRRESAEEEEKAAAAARERAKDLRERAGELREGADVRPMFGGGRRRSAGAAA